MCFIWTHGHVYCEASLSPSLSFSLSSAYFLSHCRYIPPALFTHIFLSHSSAMLFVFSHRYICQLYLSLSIYLSLNLSQSLKQAQVQEHLFSQRWDLFHTFVLMGYTPSNNNLFHIFFISIKLISA